MSMQRRNLVVRGPLVWRKAGVLQVREGYKMVGRRMSTVHEVLFVR